MFLSLHPITNKHRRISKLQRNVYVDVVPKMAVLADHHSGMPTYIQTVVEQIPQESVIVPTP